jgi:hypothetical protein
MTKSYIPPPGEPHHDELFPAVEAAPEGNPRLTELMGSVARQVVVEGHLDKP